MKQAWQKYLLYGGILIGVIMLFLLEETIRYQNTGFEGKTLWEWMELLVIPLVLGIGAFYLERSERAVERKAAEDRAKLERELATDRQQEAALQAYLDRIAEALLEENLITTRKAQVRDVARIRTLTVLRGLDATRKGLVLLFLQEAGLIRKEKTAVELTGADLQGAILENADLHDAYLEHANLCGAHLQGADLRGAQLRNANLEGADLRGAFMHNADLPFSNLQNADMEYCSLNGAKLQSAHLEDVNLVDARLEQADLQGAYLQGAQLKNADLQGANLSGAGLQHADLRGANLNSASLASADLQDADLLATASVLEEADEDLLDWFEPEEIARGLLQNANLENAKLKGAKITNEQLAAARSLQGAIMPDGTRHD